MLVLGFDPGGKGQFGWCVAEAISGGRIRLWETQKDADHAEDAVHRVIELLRSRHRDLSDIEGAGIDSPLFWARKAHRDVDRTVREAIKACGARNAGGTVQQVNSLRGACLVQGVVAAFLLRRYNPTMRITEAHPKALLWLPPFTETRRKRDHVGLQHLSDWIECDHSTCSLHGRDAALAAFAAAAMLRGCQELTVITESCAAGWIV